MFDQFVCSSYFIQSSLNCTDQTDTRSTKEDGRMADIMDKEHTTEKEKLNEE